MWSQIGRSYLTSAFTPSTPPPPGSYPSTSDVYISDVNGTIPVKVEIGYWLVITTHVRECEIRKITNIISYSPGNYCLEVSPALRNAHSVGDIVYIQTSPNWDILLFGASQQATNPIDNTKSINAAIEDANYCNQYSYSGSVFSDLSGAIVSIPKGVYEVAYNSSFNGIIELSHNRGNIKFIGEGMGVSVIKLSVMDEIPDQPIFYVADSSNIEWHDLTIDGNKDNFENTALVTCIQINGSDEDSGILNNFILNRVEIIHALYKGIDAKSTNNLHVINSKIQSCKQFGIYVQGLFQNTWINSNYFLNNLDHDLFFRAADTSSTLGKTIITENNFFNTVDYYKSSILFWGAAIINVTDKVVISNNVIEGRSLEILFAINALISNNIIIGGFKIPFKASAAVINLEFQNNIVVNKSGDNYYAIKLCNDGLYSVNGALISGNTLEGGGIYSENVSNCSYVDNKIVQGSISNNKGIVCKITLSNFADCGNLLITNNQLSLISDTGIEISTENSNWKFQLICIDTNIIDGTPIDGVNTVLYGIRIKNPLLGIAEYWTKALVGTSNVVGKATMKQIEVFGTYLVELNPYQELWICNGEPEGKLFAPQGSYAINKNMVADNKYLKCSLETLNTGWMLVSELEKQLLFKDIYNGGTGSLSSHNPTFNVFTPSTPWTTVTGGWSIVSTNIAQPSSLSGSLAIATYSMQKDGELKAVFIYDPTASATTGDVGVVFRKDSSSTTSFWKFYLSKSSGNFYLHAYKPSSTTDILNGEQVFLGNGSNLIFFVLKVEMNGDYISFFFNDRFLTSVKDSSNNTQAVHGLYANLSSTSSMFSSSSFKLLIP